jgi:hypothetical protein
MSNFDGELVTAGEGFSWLLTQPTTLRIANLFFLLLVVLQRKDSYARCNYY